LDEVHKNNGYLKLNVTTHYLKPIQDIKINRLETCDFNAVDFLLLFAYLLGLVFIYCAYKTIALKLAAVQTAHCTE
jgi:hypothetical protein